jgi:glycosyltransferase involved in cell wall biosynthesis
LTYHDRVARQLEALCPSISRTTILNGVDTDRFRPPAEGERGRLRAELGWSGRRQVLFVGRPVAKKGFPTAVSAVADSGLPDVHLAVAGADRLPPEAPSRVESLGRLSRSRLAEVYRACDALIVPARGEGFPLSAQEALASGLPLLLADDPGYAPNLAGAGTSVRSVSGSDGFGRALDELLGDPALLEDARRAAATHAREAFSWPHAIDEHETLYRQLPTQPS